MKDLKLIKLLKLLTNEDLKQIQKMVLSPYFNTNPKVIKLFKILRPHHPDFESKTISKQNIYKKIFPKITYSDIKLRKLFSELSNVLEEYIIQVELENNYFEKKKILLNGFFKRKSSDLFEKEERKVRAEIEKQPYRDEIYFKDLYDLNRIKLEQMESRDLKLRGVLLRDSLVLLDGYFELSMAEIQADMKTLVGFNASENPNQGLFISNENIVLAIHKKLTILYQKNEMETFQEIKELLFENLNKIRKNKQLDYFIYLINFLIKKMRSNDLLFNNHIFELYKSGIKNKIILQDGKISDFAFINFCVTGAKSNEINFVEKFIKKNSTLLNDENKTDIINLTSSYLFFYKKKYLKAADLLLNYNFKNNYLYLSSRIHLIRCFYEIQSQDNTRYFLFLDQLNSFEKFVRRDKYFNNDKKKSYLNFSLFLRKLSKEKGKMKFSQKKKEEFLLLLDELKITQSRSWLEEKIKI